MTFADNLIKNVKLFFSQKFTEVYDEGNLIDREALSVAKQWDFGVYHLLDVYDAELSEEVDFIPYFDLNITLRSFRVLIEDIQVIAISVITDGDDGYLEVFENEGQIIGAARYYSWGNSK